MNNNDVIYSFIDGSKKAAAANHIGFYKDKLFSYSTIICTLDRGKKVAAFNNRKYSRTTGKHQNMLRRALINNGYSIRDYTGGDAYTWNFGYMGAPNLTIDDMRRWYSA